MHACIFSNLKNILKTTHSLCWNKLISGQKASRQILPGVASDEVETAKYNE